MSFSSLWHGLLVSLLLLTSAVLAEERKTSFEEVAAGPFQSIQTSLGTWSTEAGLARIDSKHAKSGKHCLQLAGGKLTRVHLQLASTAQSTGELTFWAERWTSRAPFEFRIEKDAGAGWVEIHNGDSTVRVGRAFLNFIRVPLRDAKIRALRFTCRSPDNTGVLLDDIRIAPLQPQQVTGVKPVPFTLPVLVGSERSPIAKLRIETTGQLNPRSVSTVQLTLEGTSNEADIASLSLLLTNNLDSLSNARTLATLQGPFAADSPLTIPCSDDALLDEGEHGLWVVCRLSERADIDRRVGIRVLNVSFSDGSKHRLNAGPSIQRLGVAVRQAGEDQVHTFRIPGLATTRQGTLIGVYDVRWRGGGDLPGDIDVGMSRSTDGGRTWEPMRIIMDLGRDPKWNYDGVGDPAVLVDQKTGVIWVAATWSHGNRSWNGSGPGLKPEETGQLMLVKSEDDGQSWSQPINITQQIKHPDWCFVLQGPGKGITMQDGTLVFAAQYQDPPDKQRLPHSTIIYSKDHGKSWQVGTGAFDDTTEAQVVEVEPGVLMLNCRYNRDATRVVMTTRDLGKTWQNHPTSQRSLIEPRACMASLIDVAAERRGLPSPPSPGQPAWLLFSNPNTTSVRQRLTIKASPDRGVTWPKQFRLLLDEGRSAGYSCLTMIDEHTVGILYEGSQAHMTFQRIALSAITSETSSAPAPPDSTKDTCR